MVLLILPGLNEMLMYWQPIIRTGKLFVFQFPQEEMRFMQKIPVLVIPLNEAPD